MSKEYHTIRLRNAEAVEKAVEGVRWVQRQHQLDRGWILILTRRRTDQQSARFWAIMHTIAKARPKHHGRAMGADDYKIMFVHALRKEERFIPDIDGERIIPVAYSSKELTVSEFNDLFAIIDAWCAREEIDISHHAEAEEDKAA
jgi:hypothetical protein